MDNGSKQMISKTLGKFHHLLRWKILKTVFGKKAAILGLKGQLLNENSADCTYYTNPTIG